MYEVHVESEEFREKRMVQQHQMVNQVRAAGCSSRCTAPELQTHAQPSSGMHTAVVGTCTLLQHHVCMAWACSICLCLVLHPACVYVAALHAVCLHAQHLQLTQHTLHLHLSTTCIQHLIKSSTSTLGALKPPTFTLKWDLVFVFVSCRHCVKRSRTCMDCASSPPPPSPDTGLSSVMGRGGM